MKNHLTGTNNRTLCGMKISENTVLLDKSVKPEYMVDCLRCLDRLLDDKKYIENVIIKKLRDDYDIRRD